MAERERIEVATRDAIDYHTLDDVVKRCGGWMRTSGSGGEIAEVWVDDKTYIFTGEGLIKFLYAVKDKTLGQVYAALDLCKYVEQSAKQSPSVFVRDAIVTRAAALRQEIEHPDKATT